MALIYKLLALLDLSLDVTVTTRDRCDENGCRRIEVLGKQWSIGRLSR